MVNHHHDHLFIFTSVTCPTIFRSQISKDDNRGISWVLVVVLFLGACTKPPQLSLVTEYMEKGSLYHLLYSTDEIKNLSFKEKIKILFDICRYFISTLNTSHVRFCQITKFLIRKLRNRVRRFMFKSFWIFYVFWRGLMCIHRMGIVHRDLKSANCLLSNDWTVKICDFGLSKTMKGATIEDAVAAGTPEWVAPEVIRNEPFSEKCDIFSFGVVMWELCTLSKPWEGVPKQQVRLSLNKKNNTCVTRTQ